MWRAYSLPRLERGADDDWRHLLMVIHYPYNAVICIERAVT